jgi:transposase-like protein
MKNLLLTFCLLLSCFSTEVWAQSRRCAIQVQSRDRQPITLVMDGRHFRKYGRILTLGDIPAGRHELKVYYYYPANTRRDNYNGRRSAGRAELIYKERIRIDAGMMYYCVVNPDRGTMRVEESRMISLDERDPAYPIDGDADFSDGRNDESWEYDRGRNDGSSRLSYYNEKNRISESQMALLKSSVQDKSGASDKVRTIKLYLEDKTLITEQVLMILNWLPFEGNKVEIAKFCYPKVSDPDNYLMVSNKLSFQSSKRELEQEMQRVNQQRKDGRNSEEETNSPRGGSSKMPLTTTKFKSLKVQVDLKNSDSEKMKLLQSQLSGFSLTTTQLSDMLDWLLFEGSRLELVKWSYERLSDPGNVLNLKSKFSFASSKSDIDKLGKK